MIMKKKTNTGKNQKTNRKLPEDSVEATKTNRFSLQTLLYATGDWQ